MLTYSNITPAHNIPHPIPSSSVSPSPPQPSSILFHSFHSPSLSPYCSLFLPYSPQTVQPYPYEVHHSPNTVCPHQCRAGAYNYWPLDCCHREVVSSCCKRRPAITSTAHILPHVLTVNIEGWYSGQPKLTKSKYFMWIKLHNLTFKVEAIIWDNVETGHTLWIFWNFH